MTKVGFTGDGLRCFGEVAEARDAPVSALLRHYHRGLYEVIGALDGETASLRLTSPPGCSGSLVSVEACA